MPRSNFDLKHPPAAASLADENCPKCGTEMEPIDSAVEGLPLRQLRLCPQCYLVTWHDETGFQSRQGVPVKKPTTH